jgi:hypothetical protein
MRSSFWVWVSEEEEEEEREMMVMGFGVNGRSRLFSVLEARFVVMELIFFFFYGRIYGFRVKGEEEEGFSCFFFLKGNGELTVVRVVGARQHKKTRVV